MIANFSAQFQKVKAEDFKVVVENHEGIDAHVLKFDGWVWNPRSDVESTSVYGMLCLSYEQLENLHTTIGEYLQEYDTVKDNGEDTSKIRVKSY